MKRRRRARSSSASKRRLRSFGAWLILLGLGACALGGGFWYWTRSGGALGPALPTSIAPGSSLEQISRELAGGGFVRHPRLFAAYLSLGGRADKIRRGEHLLRVGLSPSALAARLTESPRRPIVKLSIPEGYNLFQIAERLEALEVTTRASFVAAATDPELSRTLAPAATSAEGYLFPASYELYVDSSATRVVGVLVQEALRRFERVAAPHTAELDRLRSELGWGRHEIFTLASIVEKETGHADEQGLVASVFYNRLRDPSFLPRRMLQSDPTAGYGCLLERDALASCSDFNGRITPAMLRDAGNSYNTYKRPGLPPGPIANPGESALLSVLNPPTTPYFFFVAGRNKRHVFSRTLGEHQRATLNGTVNR